MSYVFNPDAYGPAIAKLLREYRVFELGPGKPNESLRGVLKALTLVDLFQGKSVINQYMASACHCGIWLYFDFLKESHSISQNIPSTTGSLWHGIMHRRELDYSNAQYWFEKVPTHPIYEPLQQYAAVLAENSDDSPEFFRDPTQSWDALAFSSLCEQSYHSDSPLEEFCRQIQRREWELLFRYSYVNAVGKIK